MNKQQQADQAIKAYDAYIFSTFFPAFDAFKADQLAAGAVDACQAAARDRTANEATRTYYADLRDQFRAIA
jgi:hypothetical protein